MPDAERLAWLEEICQRYQAALGEEALSYLDGRGLGTSAVERFRLGQVVDPPPEHKSVQGRLALPIIKRAGVIGFQFRCIQRHACDEIEGHAKFITKGPQTTINALALDEPSTTLEIVEGNFDCYTLADVLGLAAIGIPGVKAWKRLRVPLLRALRDYREIRVWAQNDEGKKENYGRKMGEAICSELEQAWIVELPAAMDVNSVYLEDGPGALLDLAGL